MREPTNVARLSSGRPSSGRLPAITAEVIGSDDQLRFGSDDEPGIRRRGATRFRYVVERTGRPPSREDLARIRALAIPPAWTDVSIVHPAVIGGYLDGTLVRGWRRAPARRPGGLSCDERRTLRLPAAGECAGSQAAVRAQR